MSDVSLTWDEKKDEPILKDINMTVEQGQLVAIVGRVGSGKSSILSAILGDMTKQKGSIEREVSSVVVRPLCLSSYPFVFANEVYSLCATAARLFL